MKRSAFTHMCGIAVWLTVAFAGYAQTGTAVPSLSALDDVMQQALARYSVKGGALAVTKDGRLIFARGYGQADVEGQSKVQPDSLFRWCSISKTVTAAAVMRLVEQKRLDLDRPVFEILGELAPYNGVWGDSRLHGITVRQLLHHTGGWDRAISPILDPVVAEGSVKVWQAVGGAFPPSPDAAIRYVLAQRLDFAPGTRYAYSNFGYVLLGRMIEKVSGQSYESFVRENILAPAGLTQVQKGSAHLAGRLPGEVKYYDYPGAALVSSYVSATREKVAAPYGILNPDLEAGAAAWVGSAIDLAKFIAMLDGVRGPALVQADSFHQMLAQSQPATRVDSAGWYGLGLFVQPGEQGATWDHGGYNPGSKAYFYRFTNGVGVAFVFNGETADGNGVSSYAAQAIANVVFGPVKWPEADLFPQFYPPRLAVPGVVNAASFEAGAVAPECLITIFGTDLGGTGSDVSVVLRDGNVERPLQMLASLANQINAVMPVDVAGDTASLIVRRDGWPDAAAPVTIAAVTPGLFRLNAEGLAAASVVRSRAGAAAAWEDVYRGSESGSLVARPIVFGSEEETLTLILYGTGIRRRKAGSKVSVRLGNSSVGASYAGAQVQYAGLDQINLELPRTLMGAGSIEVKVEVDGVWSNSGTLTFR